jgi:hypothetical protein
VSTSLLRVPKNSRYSSCVCVVQVHADDSLALSRAGFPSSDVEHLKCALSEGLIPLELLLTQHISIALVTFSDGSAKIKMSIDEAKQCLDWKDGSTDIAQTYAVSCHGDRMSCNLTHTSIRPSQCEDANRNQHWIKTDDKRFVPE